VKTGEKTLSRSAVDVATRGGGVTGNTAATSSHDTGANSFDTVKRSEIEVRNNRSNLRGKKQAVIRTSRNMHEVETQIGPTRCGVRQLDSQDETTATRDGHPTRDNLSARGRGGRARRNMGGNRVTHREIHL